MVEIGNIVVAKNDKRLLGEVLAIDEMDRATVKLCESGVEVLVDIVSLYCTGSNQPQRERAVKRYIFWVQSIKSLSLRREITVMIERRMAGWILWLRKFLFLTISRML